MERLFDSMPIWVAMPLVIIGVAGLAVFGSYQFRKRHSLEELMQNNEIAGFKFGVIGVLYAVMLGMAVVAVWEDFENAQSNAAKEAGLIGDIHRDAQGLPPIQGEKLRTEIKAYASGVIVNEWTSMQSGYRDEKTQTAFESLFPITLSVEPKNAREQMVLGEIFSKLNDLADQRRARLSEAREGMPGLLWLALLAGGGVTIVFTFFFGNRNWRAHCMMTAILSGLIAMMLYVIHEIDHPYSGSVRVSPDALQGVLDRISR